MSDRESLLLVGPLVGVAGALIMVFHRPFVRLAQRLPLIGRQRAEAMLPYLFRPTPGGYVRILWVISAGWVAIGVLWTLAGLGVVPT